MSIDDVEALFAEDESEAATARMDVGRLLEEVPASTRKLIRQVKIEGQSIADAAAAARDNVSQVDLDKEASELIRFQQAYSAAARTIQVARETMQTLLSSI